MSIQSPLTPSEITVQIAALRAVVHALLRDVAINGDGRTDAIHRRARAEIDALPFTPEIRERSGAAIDEIFTGEHAVSPPAPAGVPEAPAGTRPPNRPDPDEDRRSFEPEPERDRSPGQERERKWSESQGKGSGWSG